jgi:hypothetical protein
MFVYFTDNAVTYNICKKGSSKTLSLHLFVQQLKALELALGCRLEVMHITGTTMITQGTDGLSRGIWANGFNTYFKSFAVEVFLPAFPSPSLTKWALSHIEIHEEHAPWWNDETDTSLCEPKKIMHTKKIRSSPLALPYKASLLPSWLGWNPPGIVHTSS